MTETRLVTERDQTDRLISESDLFHHRMRFVAPILVGKSVMHYRANTYECDDSHQLQYKKLPTPDPIATEPGVQGEVVLALDGISVIGRGAKQLCDSVAANGVLVVFCPDTLQELERAERRTLVDRFIYIRRYVQRRMSGSLILEDNLISSRVAPLADNARDLSDSEKRHPFNIGAIWVCSNNKIPNLSNGVFERSSVQTTDFKAASAYAASKERLGLIAQNGSDEEAFRARAAALVDRATALGEETFRLSREIAGLKIKLAEVGPLGNSSDRRDVPTHRYEWPLAAKKTKKDEALDPYERRVDDAVILQGLEGEKFFERFDLKAELPNFAAAVDELNAMTRRCRPLSDANAIPTVSVIIPIFGQLSYTLNCLHSLFGHESSFSFEIIVVDDVSPDESVAFLPNVKGIRYVAQQTNGGFIASCNTGGQLAKGKILVFLNNDTRVVAGWLDELVAGFTRFPRAGVVGSKLHYEDGMLQEAGGITWRDGSCWNYGRNDDPNRPQYSYARQVDYISGCSLAIPIHLWRNVNGFDPHFAPAYCEDVDLCFRVRACGQQVWFNPGSRVVHYEGRSSGTDTKFGVKAYQILNTRKLFLRYRETLTSHRRNGEHPFLERERSVGKRILVIDALTPTPDQDAGSVQTLMALKVCQEIGYKPSFVPEDNWLFVPKYTPQMQIQGVECAYAPFELGIESYLSRYGWSFDVALIYRGTTFTKVIDMVRLHAPQAAVLFHLADLHFLRMQRTADLDGNAQLSIEAQQMKELELGAIGKADCTITHSAVEADLLSQLAPDSAVALWPLMFDYFGTDRGFNDRRDICFLGGYRHPPNVDAVTYFVNEIFPILKQAEPDLRFIVAGANPTDDVMALARSDIVVTGLVEDLREVFDSCRVFVCPLRVGAGAKGKVISALSYGIPVVSTSVGVEGTQFNDNQHVLIADTPRSFAAAVLKVYRERQIWERLSQEGQAFVRDTLSQKMGQTALLEAIDKGYENMRQPNLGA